MASACLKSATIRGGGEVKALKGSGLYLHMGNIGDSGVTLSDAGLKIGRKQ